jgi:glutaredoxin
MRVRERKLAVVVTMSLAALLAGCSGANSGADPEIVFFYLNDCDDCARMKEVLTSLLGSAPTLRVAYHEIKANEAMLLRLHRRYGLGTTDYDSPEIFVGRTVIVGQGRTQELALRKAVEACATGGCPSPLK